MNPLHLVPKVVRRAQLGLIRHDFARALRHHGQVAALGDSITHGLGQTRHLKNLGVHGETSHGLLKSMPNYKHVMCASSAVLLMIGTNDVWQGIFHGIEHRLEAITEAIPTSKPLIWSAIPPSAQLSMRRIKSINRHIEQLARARANTAFVDTWSLFSDAHGRQVHRYFLEDELHLSPAGYRRWASELKRFLN